MGWFNGLRRAGGKRLGLLVGSVSQTVRSGRGENMTEVRLRLSVIANRCLAQEPADQSDAVWRSSLGQRRRQQ